MIKVLITKINNHLRNPLKIPSKILRKINYFLKLKNYNFNFYKNKQDDIFHSCGLNRDEGIQNLNKIKKKIDLNVNTNREMSSEHEIMLSSISIKKNIKIENILEIGTYDGFNALLLSMGRARWFAIGSKRPRSHLKHIFGNWYRPKLPSKTNRRLGV